MARERNPLFSWLDRFSPELLQGVLIDIFVAAEAGAPMRRASTAECLVGAGLRGDRYALGGGHWRRTDACEVTLVSAEELVRAAGRSTGSFADGQHRRNLVVQGLALDACRRRRIRIGEVELVFQRLRPPCGYLDRLLWPGAGRALGRGAGIGLKVLTPGVIRVGDRVQVLTDEPAS